MTTWPLPYCTRADAQALPWKMILVRSRGATAVLASAPARAPDSRELSTCLWSLYNRAPGYRLRNQSGQGLTEAGGDAHWRTRTQSCTKPLVLVCMHGAQSSALVFSITILCFSVDLGLTDLAGLGGQQAPGSSNKLSALAWAHRHMASQLLAGPGGLNSGLQTLQTCLY